MKKQRLYVVTETDKDGRIKIIGVCSTMDKAKNMVKRLGWGQGHMNTEKAIYNYCIDHWYPHEWSRPYPSA